MSRTLVTLAIGGSGVSFVRWHLWQSALKAVSDQVVSSVPHYLLHQLGVESTFAFWNHFFYVGAVWISWELRYEILSVLRASLYLVWILLSWLSLLCDWLLKSCCLTLEIFEWVTSNWPWGVPHILRERGANLTSMAVVPAPAAGGGVPFPVGSFLLVSRPPVWDETWIAGYLPNQTDFLARTTSADGGEWTWAMVKITAMAVRPPAIQPDGTRRAPAGINQNAVNWIYSPPACDTMWDPEAVEVVNLMQEAQVILTQLNQSMNGVTLNTAGVGGDLVPLTIGGGAPAPGGGGGAAPAGGVAGLGMQSGSGSPTAEELKALEKAVQQLQAMAISSEEDRKKAKKDKEKEKDRKKSRKSDKKHKKHRKKKKKRSRSSSSSSNTSRSRSRSSSSSSTSSKKPLAWKERGKDRRVAYDDLTHVDQLKLKKKGDLLSFASKNPGALTAHFLASVYARLSKGTVSRSSQLREASVSAWAHMHSGLTEPRDIKEVLTLAEVLDHVNRREIARALDIIVQRIVAIQAARAKGGTWEKAENLELVSNQRTLAPSSMLALTNAWRNPCGCLGSPWVVWAWTLSRLISSFSGHAELLGKQCLKLAVMFSLGMCEKSLGSLAAASGFQNSVGQWWLVLVLPLNMFSLFLLSVDRASLCVVISALVQLIGSSMRVATC